MAAGHPPPPDPRHPVRRRRLAHLAGRLRGLGLGGGGLVGLLVLIAAITLAFTGEYPRPLLAIILGTNRWALRVIAYTALMTDRYPPFRLDLGGDDPGGPTEPVGEPTVQSAPAVS